MITIKWPRLLVVGKPITEEQADEVLLRTDSWYFGCNDRAWTATLTRVCGEFGQPVEPPHGASGEDRIAYYQANRAWREQLGILDIHYLHNSRIVSAYIGGPHGWCDWDGTIGSSAFNIGKWPSDQDVTEDWQAIAEAFPYLDLTAQVINHEEEGGSGSIAGQWRVLDGKVEYTDSPTELIRSPTDTMELDVARLLFDVRRERGVSEERFRSALARLIQESETAR